MRPTQTVQLCARGLVTALMLAAVPLPALAQAQPAIRVITHFRVKPERAGDWIAAEKEYAALVAKAGSDRSYVMWQALTGPREYIMVRYYSKWADLDTNPDPKLAEHASAMTAILGRANAASDSSWREIHSMDPDLTMPRPDRPPPMIRVNRINVAPGKADDVLALLKSVTLPAMKTAGVTAFGVGRVRYGAGTNQLMTHTGFNNWADLDAPTPIEKTAGRPAYLAYIEKFSALTTRSEWTVYRFLPELSYLAPAR